MDGRYSILSYRTICIVNGEYRFSLFCCEVGVGLGRMLFNRCKAGAREAAFPCVLELAPLKRENELGDRK